MHGSVIVVPPVGGAGGSAGRSSAASRARAAGESAPSAAAKAANSGDSGAAGLRPGGLDVAKTVLGHSKVEATLIYAEKDLRAAKDVVRKLG